MAAGRVDTLLCLDSNPVYTAPSDLAFGDRMDKVRLRVHLGLHQDETAARCHWQVPMAHYLESWSDARAADGTASIVQPLVAPLYDGRTPHDLVAALTNESGRTSHEIVRAYWQQRAAAAGVADFEKFWRRALHDGLVQGTAAAVKTVTPQAPPPGPAAPASGLEVTFRPDPSVFDGRFANNAWLQELPKPATKLTWDNAALLSPATAERLGVTTGDLVALRLDGRTVTAPVWVQPGQAAGSVAVHLGYGRSRAGQVGNGAGFNAYALRASGTLWIGHGLEIARTGGRYELATTQNQQTLQGRDLVRAASLEEYRQRPHFAHETSHAPSKEMTLYPEVKYQGHAWAMAIDLTTCIGLQRVRRGLQRREQHPGRGQDRGPPRPQDALAADRPVPQGRPGAARGLQPACPVHALRERALRGGLPGRGDRRTATRG